MGFLKSLFAGREISRLEELIQVSPAPSLFMRLAQLYRETEEEEKANAITRQGAEMFPDSEALTQAHADVERIKNEAEKHRLRARIEQYPSPMLYAKLAEICLKEDNLDEAEKACNHGIRAYPDYGGLWNVLARIAEKRGEMEQALEFLEKSTSLDKYNYNALYSLAEVSARLGQRDKTRAALEKILFFAPDDVRVKDWLADFDNRVDKLQAKADSAGGSKKEKVRTTLLDQRHLQQQQQSAEDPRKASGVGTSLHIEIREIRRVEGVQGSILIDANGLVIASDLAEDLDEELTGALVANICRSAEQHSDALTIGAFEDGIIDAGHIRFHVLRIAEMIVGVMATPQTKAGLLQRAVHTFAEHVLEETES